MKHIHGTTNPEVWPQMDSPDIAVEEGHWGEYRYRVYDRNRYDGPGSAPIGLGRTLSEAMTDLHDRESIFHQRQAE